MLGGARGRWGHECSTAWPIKEGVSPQLPHSTAMLCATDVVNWKPRAHECRSGFYILPSPHLPTRIHSPVHLNWLNSRFRQIEVLSKQVQQPFLSDEGLRVWVALRFWCLSKNMLEISQKVMTREFDILCWVLWRANLPSREDPLPFPPPPPPLQNYAHQFWKGNI